MLSHLGVPGNTHTLHKLIPKNNVWSPWTRVMSRRVHRWKSRFVFSIWTLRWVNGQQRAILLHLQPAMFAMKLLHYDHSNMSIHLIWQGAGNAFFLLLLFLLERVEPRSYHSLKTRMSIVAINNTKNSKSCTHLFFDHGSSPSTGWEERVVGKTNTGSGLSQSSDPLSVPPPVFVKSSLFYPASSSTTAAHWDIVLHAVCPACRVVRCLFFEQFCSCRTVAEQWTAKFYYI